MADEARSIAIKADESAKSAHKRLDSVDDEIKGLREAKHDLYGKHHTVAAVVSGIDGSVNKLFTAVKEWEIKTELNTMEGIKMRTTFVVGIAVTSFLGSAFAAFVVFAGGKILKWW
jgi:prophage DNA circulation protein